MVRQILGMNQEEGPETEVETDQSPGDGPHSPGLKWEDMISQSRGTWQGWEAGHELSGTRYRP